MLGFSIHWQSRLVELNGIDLALRLERKKTKIGEIAKLISESTNEILKRMGTAEPLFNRFRQEGFYRWNNVRYFLYEYNMHLQLRSKTDRRKIDWRVFSEHRKDYISIEHIYPQRARDPYWRERFGKYSDKQKSSLRNSIGNLLPLSVPKNASLSNKRFAHKVEGVKDMVVGYRYGSYAENEVAGYSDWTPETILQRGLVMLEFLEQRWDLKLGDRTQKAKLLGLEFLESGSKQKK